MQIPDCSSPAAIGYSAEEVAKTITGIKELGVTIILIEEKCCMAESGKGS